MSKLSYLTDGKKNQVVKTPRELIRWIGGHWNLIADIAADEHNTICHGAFVTEERDSLAQNWGDLFREFGGKFPEDRLWCNPPFKHILPWVKKAKAMEAPCLMLLPATLESKWFLNHVYLDTCTVYVLSGRLSFEGYSGSAGQGHMLIDWDSNEWGGIGIRDWKSEPIQESTGWPTC